MKKRFFILALSLMFTLLLIKSPSISAAADVRSYEFANNNTRLVSSDSNWNNGLTSYYLETGRDLRPYVSDFTPKLTLEIVSANEIHVIFRITDDYVYDLVQNGYYYYSVDLFNFGDLSYGTNYYTYNGNSNYGDANHRNGTNVQPFFLFLRGTGTAYAPTFVGRYNSSYFYAAFFLNVPTNQNFTMGISFTTIHKYYRDDSGWDYTSRTAGSTNIILSNNLYFNL